MRIDDIRVWHAAGDGGSAEVILRDGDGAEIRIGLPIGPAGGNDRAAILDEVRSLLNAAVDAIGATKALPDGLTPVDGNENVSLDTLDDPDGGRPLASLEEDDDNAYQEPDEALPDEREEQALAAGLARGRFGDPA